MTDNIFDLYVDGLISSFGAVTGLSDLADRMTSHDKITRMLSVKPRTSEDLRFVVKPLIREIESPG